MGSLADTYQLDDPNTGTINKQGFADYLEGMRQVVEGVRRKTYDPLLNLTEVVTPKEGGILTAWCSWAVPGTPIQGSGLIKVGDQGVISERLFTTPSCPNYSQPWGSIRAPRISVPPAK